MTVKVADAIAGLINTKFNVSKAVASKRRLGENILLTMGIV